MRTPWTEGGLRQVRRGSDTPDLALSDTPDPALMIWRRGSDTPDLAVAV